MTADNNMLTPGFDMWREAQAEDLREVLQEVIEHDEQNGGYSPNRPEAYQVAFKATMALIRSPGGLVLYEDFVDHIDDEIRRLVSQIRQNIS